MTTPSPAKLRRLAGAVVLLAVGASVWLSRSDPPPAGGYVGSQACARCHAEAFAAWRESDHAHALHRAEAPFVRAGGPARFEASGEAWQASATGAAVEGGQRLAFGWTIGWDPLQQYLVAGERGRWQALPVAWDTRKGEWFDSFAGDPRLPGDWGHWSGRGMTANAMCIECHVTGFDKGYRAEDDSYATTWKEAGVGCEACHGPGAAHIAWDAAGRRSRDSGMTRLATLPPARGNDLCARCHARRVEIAPGFRPGDDLLDHFAPELLESPDAYHADGLVQGESFEYGSFLQSKMHRAGVRCSQCHEPHAARLRLPGNALCLQCHKPELDGPAHTHHPPGAGADCVSCHMPVVTFMGRDARRDHSFQVPAPEVGAHNACTRCHADRDVAWAADAVRSWFGEKARRPAVRARAFAAAGRGDPGARAPLLALLRDPSEPAVVRAAAAQFLQGSAPEAFGDPEPLVRAAAAAGVADRPADPRPLLPLLRDPVRLVRVRAVWALRASGAENSPGWNEALAEFLAAPAASADLPVTHFNLGVFWSDRGEPSRAVEAYGAALRRLPDFVPALFNRALALHALGRRTEAEADYRRALELDPSLRERLPR